MREKSRGNRDKGREDRDEKEEEKVGGRIRRVDGFDRRFRRKRDTTAVFYVARPTRVKGGGGRGCSER